MYGCFVKTKILDQLQAGKDKLASMSIGGGWGGVVAYLLLYCSIQAWSHNDFSSVIGEHEETVGIKLISCCKCILVPDFVMVYYCNITDIGEKNY